MKTNLIVILNCILNLNCKNSWTEVQLLTTIQWTRCIEIKP